MSMQMTLWHYIGKHRSLHQANIAASENTDSHMLSPHARHIIN
jgi:hypothetical protein